MGFIKEPDGIDFVVDSKPLTDKDGKRISDAIALFKTTGKKELYSPILLKKKRQNTSA